MRTLVWLRSDLRSRDNTALHHAAKASDQGVVCIYIISPEDWRAHDTASVRVDFVLRTLEELSDALNKLNIPLIVETAEAKKDIPRILLETARKRECAALRFNIEYEVNESRRDAKVTEAFLEAGLAVHAHHDQTVIPPGDIRTGDDGFYSVFSPFKKNWLRTLGDRGAPDPLPAPDRQDSLKIKSSSIPGKVKGFESDISSELWPAGEEVAQRVLDTFCDDRIDDYKDRRDFPAEPATSRLSPYLAVGAISARQCLAAAMKANKGRADGGRQGPAHWISELVWREFYRHIIVGYPRVSMGRAMRTETDEIEWSYDEDAFDRWRRGMTGFPIVDAAMRQLLEVGWMHNRMRMVAAMFLTKDLLIDWRWGERHFMQHLIDGDLAQNNGGWQWSASTGADAAPYFRIFNPVSQSRKFDPDGEFIRRYVPELADVDAKDIHDPERIASLLRGELDYPEPMVDHGDARERAIKAFKAQS